MADVALTPRHAADVATMVREARGARAPLRIAGAGSWLHAGAPVSSRHELRVDALAGVVSYEPGDLTLTARAGTTLEELSRITAAEGQWLPLDPFGPESGTIGATVATASAGPLAAAFGTPRDQVLGCEVVTGRGEIVRAGGRVVKNVAGFDLTRLQIGAWGTLGVITEVTVRLRARPERDETIVVALRGADSIAAAQRWFRHSPFSPFAAEVLSPALARQLGIGDEATLLLRMGGNERLVRAALAAAGEIGEHRMAPSTVWRTLRLAEPAGATVLRLSAAPSRTASLWRDVATIADRAGGFAHWTPQRGVVRCVLPSVDADDLHQSIAALPAATRVMERAPASVWSRHSMVEPNERLARGIRDAFDPDRILNPGVLGGSA